MAHDVFISYSHANKDSVLFLVEELQRSRPQLRLFLDRNVLDAGVAWQQKIYDAIDDCHTVVAVYSPEYLGSKMCREEYNIARIRDRDSDNEILLPLYLYSVNLPPHMRVVQYLDCREADKEKIRAACRQILSKLDESEK